MWRHIKRRHGGDFVGDAVAAHIVWRRLQFQYRARGEIIMAITIFWAEHCGSAACAAWRQNVVTVRGGG